MHRVLLAPALYAVDSFFPTQPQKTVRSVDQEDKLTVLEAIDLDITAKQIFSWLKMKAE